MGYRVGVGPSHPHYDAVYDTYGVYVTYREHDGAAPVRGFGSVWGDGRTPSRLRTLLPVARARICAITRMVFDVVMGLWEWGFCRLILGALAY